MKKKVNYVIIALTVIVLIWGIVASCITLGVNNPKTQQATYAKDGRIIVTYDVETANNYKYVKKTEAEVITRLEHYSRAVKYCKIVVDKAEKDYKADKAPAKLNTLNDAKVNYKLAKTTANNFRGSIFISSSSTFFSTYFPVVVLLSIGLMINTKVNYNCKED